MRIVPCLAVFLLCATFCSAEELKVYDENWNLKYRVEDGRIYDRDWRWFP